jgi:hypothetical protein
VKGAGARLLLGQQRAMPLGEVLVEGVAAIADRLGEVGPVGLLKGEERLLVIEAQTL